MADAQGLHATCQEMDIILSADYWRRICPGLHLGDSDFQLKVQQRQKDVASDLACTEVRRRLLDEGFAALHSEELRWSVDVKSLSEGILALERHGWPPTFIAIFDEAWAMAADAQKVMERATGNTMCMDIVAFLVDPRRSKGFSPHRDRQPEDWMPRGVPAPVSATFREDGMAKYVTLWAALTDAHPDNSCLHYVPSASDSGYFAGDPDDADPMQRCFSEKAAFREIRSAPVSAGGCTFHTHRTIHWGNSGRPSYVGSPRIALSFGFSTSDFEPPYFKLKHLPFPSLDLRLALVSAQVLNYATLAAGDQAGWTTLAGSMAGCSSGMLTLLHRIFQRRLKAFDPMYRKEIAKKFVAVSIASTGSSSSSTPKEASANGTAKEGGSQRLKRTKHAMEDSDDDAALEAMLSAEADCGEVMFHDDFDLLNADACADPDMAGPKRSKGARRAKRRCGGGGSLFPPARKKRRH